MLPMDLELDGDRHALQVIVFLARKKVVGNGRKADPRARRWTRIGMDPHGRRGAHAKGKAGFSVRAVTWRREAAEE